MSRSHHQQHLFPILSVFLVLVGIVMVVQADITFNAWIISIVSVLYFVANLIYGHLNKQLSLVRTIELGAVTILIEFIALQCLI